MAVIDVHSFGFTYPGSQRPAVRDVAFSVEPREIFGFLGPNGAGKSTTQNVLIRVLDGYEGNVAVLGKDLRAWDRGYYRRIDVAFGVLDSFGWSALAFVWGRNRVRALMHSTRASGGR